MSSASIVVKSIFQQARHKLGSEDHASLTSCRGLGCVVFVRHINVLYSTPPLTISLLCTLPLEFKTHRITDMRKAKTEEKARLAWSKDEVNLLKKLFPQGRARDRQQEQRSDQEYAIRSHTGRDYQTKQACQVDSMDKRIAHPTQRLQTRLLCIVNSW